MRRLIIVMISLMLVGSAFAQKGKHDGVRYNLKSWKVYQRVGEVKDVPCPCVWNKKRGRGEDFVVRDRGNVWKCVEWNDRGKCEYIMNSVKSE